ncbi:MAG: magnesium protoporphyrin IX methyltransferase [Rhodobacteraceae bacterium]|nr:magnesium protoporphyrin IX methyltransferase [Paracoccaceae bacterium]
MSQTETYLAARERVESYFDRTATKTWERLTSDTPVSGIRATVRAGRDLMREVLLGTLPADLRGARVLDAGCGTGALAVALASRGADVVAVDISPALIDIAVKRCPANLAAQIDFRVGDMTAPGLGCCNFAVAMDSLIYYSQPDLVRILQNLGDLIGSISFTVAPRSILLMAMWRMGKFFPRSDKSPVMVPHSVTALAKALPGLHDVERVTSGFYISHALEYRP